MKNIFISYSHQDAPFKDMLVEQLKFLELERFCDIWEDSRIQSEADWNTEIKKAIDEADFAVLIISPGYFFPLLSVTKSFRRNLGAGKRKV